MRNIILSLILFVAINSIAQNEYETRLRTQYITLKQEGWMSLSMGMMTHAVGLIPPIYGNMKEPRAYGGFIFCQTIGIGLDILAFRKLYKARKIKLSLNSLPKYH